MFSPATMMSSAKSSEDNRKQVSLVRVRLRLTGCKLGKTVEGSSWQVAHSEGDEIFACNTSGKSMMIVLEASMECSNVTCWRIETWAIGNGDGRSCGSGIIVMLSCVG